MPTSRSRHKVGIGYRGPIDAGVLEVIAECHERGVYVSGNFARERSTYIGLAASSGWITTVSLDGLSYGKVWNATLEGLQTIRSHAYGHCDH